MTLDVRRPVFLVLLLVVAAAGVGLFMLSRAGKSNNESSSAQPVVATHKPVQPAAKPKAKPAPAPTARRAAPVRPKTVVAAAPDPLRLPVAVRRALAADQVVVIALYDPKAKIDGTALGEARAGARLAGSSFVAIDVRRPAATSINALYGAIQDPAVLVLRPDKSLVVRIDGFADRDTVAQAAANATS